MLFCAESDIIADFKGLVVSATSAVTTTTMAELITQESNYIRARAGNRYDMSVFDASGSDLLYPEAYSILKRICTFRVSLRVRNIIEVKREETQKSSDQKYSNNGVRTQKDDLEMIVKGELLLKNVPILVENGSVSSFAIDDCCSNVFKTGSQQW